MNAITVELSKMALAPGDVVVLRADFPLTVDQRDHIIENLRAALPEGIKCLALTKGMRLEVYTAEGGAEIVSDPKRAA